MKYPVLFLGHGSPMLAIEDTPAARGLKAFGKEFRETYEKPKAILMISAHWYTHGSRIQTVSTPKQVYDMYGFPEELYQVKYPVTGYKPLSDRVQELLGDTVTVDDTWGIDHGTWTVLIHVFPEADIPVVQLSVDMDASPEECFAIGEKLAVLREEGYLICASGNVVHNLRMVRWDMQDGTPQCKAFNDTVVRDVVNHDLDPIIHYDSLEYADYAVPTPDHYLPLLYTLGAAKEEPVTVFNNLCDLGSMALTGFRFGE